MTEIAQNDILWAGDNRTYVITVHDQQGQAIDLTGATAFWRLAKSAKAAADLVSKASATGGIVLDEVGGTWRLSVFLDHADTVNIPPGEYYHEARVILDSKLYTVAVGMVEIKSTLSRTYAGVT